MTPQNDIARIHFSYLASVLLLVLAIAGCSTNPFTAAQTTEQTAYAIERSYNIVLLGALDLINSPVVSDSTKARIRKVEAKTTPTIDALSRAASAYTVAKAEISQGNGSKEQLAIVAANLENWIKQAEIAIVSLANIVDKGDSP